jgi:hypothetical protein
MNIEESKVLEVLERLDKDVMLCENRITQLEMAENILMCESINDVTNSIIADLICKVRNDLIMCRKVVVHLQGYKARFLQLVSEYGNRDAIDFDNKCSTPSTHAIVATLIKQQEQQYTKSLVSEADPSTEGTAAVIFLFTGLVLFSIVAVSGLLIAEPELAIGIMMVGLCFAALFGLLGNEDKNSANNTSVVTVINMLKPQKIGEMKVASPPPPPRVKHPLVPPPLKKSPDNWNIDLDYEEYVKALKKLR